MYRELADHYRKEIFQCTRCQQRLMNPYLHSNPKHDPPDSPQYPENRRRYQLDYIASKRDVKLLVVGEAPGLDGCGYDGIAFTGEFNAVCHLGLTNYHGTVDSWQKEQSANLIYGAVEAYCHNAGCTISQAASKFYLTNAVMCVPLGKNGRSIASPAKATRLQCRENLVRQVSILQPQAVLTLGANALGAVAVAFGLEIQGKLTDLVREQRQGNQYIAGPGFELLAEIHPSPRNRVLGDLYTALPGRLVNIFTRYLGRDLMASERNK